MLHTPSFLFYITAESWYIPYVSSDNDLGNSMRATIDHIVATIASRAKHVDWALFVSRHCTETLSDCFRILKDSVRELQSSDSSFASSSVESRLNAIWMTVATKYNLHQGKSVFTDTYETLCRVSGTARYFLAFINIYAYFTPRLFAPFLLYFLQVRTQLSARSY